MVTSITDELLGWNGPTTVTFTDLSGDSSFEQYRDIARDIIDSYNIQNLTTEEHVMERVEEEIWHGEASVSRGLNDVKLCFYQQKPGEVWVRRVSFENREQSHVDNQ